MSYAYRNRLAPRIPRAIRFQGRKRGRSQPGRRYAKRRAMSRRASSLIPTISGRGAYNIGSRASITRVPTFDGGHGVRISHREYIRDISSATSFTNLVYSVNPGLDDTFPWLSQIARSFEKYKLMGMIFHFKSTSATALSSTNTALGKIIMSADYNPGDDDYTMLQQAYNSMHTVSGNPSQDIMFPVECDPKNFATKNFFVRSGPVPDDQDVRLYDVCKVNFITDGSQAAAVVGELWVTYDIILFSPVFGAGVDRESCTSSATTGITDAQPLGTNQSASTDTIGITITAAVTANTATIAFPPGMGYGRFFVTLAISGSSTAITIPTFTGTNCTVGGTVSNDGDTTTTMIMTMDCVISSQGAYITVDGTSATIPASATSSVLNITSKST
jgi:hypothetical protein